MVVIGTMQGQHSTQSSFFGMIYDELIQHSTQSSFFGMIYDELIPADHLLRQIAATVDLSFVSDLVNDCYCPDNGRPSWDPLVVFNVVSLRSVGSRD